MSVDVARGASAPRASPPASRRRAAATSPWSSTTARALAAAGVFTANRVKAAPVLWTQQVVGGGEVRAVVLNSGGANACTGPAGFADTHHTAEHLARSASRRERGQGAPGGGAGRSRSARPA